MGGPGQMELKRLHLPIGFRPIDFVIFSLLAGMLFLQLIEGAELSEVENVVKRIQMEGRP
jgi:hypothetical protein